MPFQLKPASVEVSISRSRVAVPLFLAGKLLPKLKIQGTRLLPKHIQPCSGLFFFFGTWLSEWLRAFIQYICPLPPSLTTKIRHEYAAVFWVPVSTKIRCLVRWPRLWSLVSLAPLSPVCDLRNPYPLPLVLSMLCLKASLDNP